MCLICLWYGFNTRFICFHKFFMFLYLFTCFYMVLSVFRAVTRLRMLLYVINWLYMFLHAHIYIYVLCLYLAMIMRTIYTYTPKVVGASQTGRADISPRGILISKRHYNKPATIIHKLRCKLQCYAKCLRFRQLANITTQTQINIYTSNRNTEILEGNISNKHKRIRATSTGHDYK